MTVPVSVPTTYQVLDAHGMSWRSIAKRGGRGYRDTVAKVRREGGLLSPDRSAPYRGRRSSIRSGRRRWTGGCRRTRFMPRKYGTPPSAYDRLVSEKGYEGLVFAGAAVRETRRASPPSDGYLEPEVASGRGAGRFRHGAGRGRRGPGRRALTWSSRSRIRTCATALALPGRTPECVSRLRTVFEHIGAVP